MESLVILNELFVRLDQEALTDTSLKYTRAARIELTGKHFFDSLGTIAVLNEGGLLQSPFSSWTAINCARDTYAASVSSMGHRTDCQIPP